MIRVLVVDDHPLMRKGVIQSLEGYKNIDVVSQASNGIQALELVAKWQPDVVLLDIQMPKMDGISCAKELLHLHAKVKIIMLSMFQEKVMYDKLKEMGVHGYLLKTSEANQIAEALERVFNGKKYFKLGIEVFEPDVHKNIDVPIDDNTKTESLSERELQVLKCLSKGMSSNEIGNELNISSRTVDTHRNNIMKKTDIHKVAGLIRFAFKVGIA